MRERAPPKRNYEDEEWSKSESKKTALKILANLNRVFIYFFVVVISTARCNGCRYSYSESQMNN